MNVAQAFGAEISLVGPNPDAEGHFFVTHPPDVDHQEFMVRLLGFLGTPDRLLLHHRTGFAVVRLPFGRAGRLKASPWVAVCGGIQFDPERFAAITGIQP